MTRGGIPLTHPRRRRGFTLIELIVSCAIIAVVMVGMMSSVLIAGRAVSRGATDTSAIAAGNAAAVIVNELRTALSVTELTPTAVTFTVPPRNGDASPETIRYAWSGASGASLTRQYNGGTAANLLDSVQALRFTYDKSTTSTTQATESAEQTFWSYIGLLSLSNQNINNNNWNGQTFTPSGIPANATSWKVTRVQYMARIHGSATGQTDVQLRTLSGGLPTATIVDHTAMLESSLTSSFAWTTTAFANAGNLTPGSSMCVVFQWLPTSDADSCDIQLSSLTSLLSGGSYLKTSNAGSAWTSNALQSVNLVVYGTYTASANVTLYNLQTVGLTLQAGSAASSTVVARAQILNNPQVTGP
jgi:prepilin-type N-terminal cleavage/methylation domain-containing protein